MNILKKVKFKLGELIGKIFGRKFFWNLEAMFKTRESILSGCKDDEEFKQIGKDDAMFLINLKLVNRDSKVLDIGCGIGRVENFLSDYVNEIHGVDISSLMIKKAKMSVRKNNVFFHVNNGSSLEMFENKYFDLIFSFYVFQHFSKNIAYEYIKEISRILKKNGKFLCQFQYKDENEQINDPNEEHPWGIRLYNKNDILLLAEKGNLNVIDYIGFEEAKKKRLEGINHDKCNVYAIMQK